MVSSALRQELGASADPGRPIWLLLDSTEATTAPASGPSPLEVKRVLLELQTRFLERQHASPAGTEPDLEAFLREKLRSLGLEDLGTQPLLPELHREVLRGLGVGLGSQMSQLLGRQVGWHGDPKASPPPAPPESPGGPRLVRLELGVDLIRDRAATQQLRHDLQRLRRRLSHKLGWAVSAFLVVPCKEIGHHEWRLSVRNQTVAQGHGLPALAEQLESRLEERAGELLTFTDFETLLRQPGCKLVVRELRSMGLEKAALWAICRQAVGAGGDLREPLTVLERILLASLQSREVSCLVQAALGQHPGDSRPL